MDYLYKKYGTNYQITRIENSYDDQKNRVDAIIYWQNGLLWVIGLVL